MPRYVIERELPGAGKLSPAELRAVAQKSVSVLQGLGTDIQWVTTYVTDDKLYCVYNAPSPALIEEHARPSTIQEMQECRILAFLRAFISGVTTVAARLR